MYLFNHHFRNVTVNDLAVPDTYCSPQQGTGAQCPEGMTCEPLELSRRERGFNGFDEFGKSNVYYVRQLSNLSTIKQCSVKYIDGM